MITAALVSLIGSSRLFLQMPGIGRGIQPSDGFLNQAKDFWARLQDAAKTATKTGDIGECERLFNLYRNRFDRAIAIRNEIMLRLAAGQDTSRVAAGVLPPGWVERLAFRDEQGRIARILERTGGAE